MSDEGGEFDWDADDFDPDAGFQKDGQSDQWEGEDVGLDIEAVKAKPEPVVADTQPSEPKKSKDERIAEKKAQRRLEEQAKLKTPAQNFETVVPDKVKQQQMQEASDLAVAMDTFGVSPSTGGGVLETMDPKEEEEFDKFREALCDKIANYESSQHYTMFVEKLLVKVCKELDVEDLRHLSTTLSTLASEKQKAKAPKTKKKGKVSLGAKAVGKASKRFDNFGDDGDDDLGAEFDDFL